MQHNCAHCNDKIERERRQFGVILCLPCESAWLRKALQVLPSKIESWFDRNGEAATTVE